MTAAESAKEATRVRVSQLSLQLTEMGTISSLPLSTANHVLTIHPIDAGARILDEQADSTSYTLCVRSGTRTDQRDRIFEFLRGISDEHHCNAIPYATLQSDVSFMYNADGTARWSISLLVDTLNDGSNDNRDGSWLW